MPAIAPQIASGTLAGATTFTAVTPADEQLLVMNRDTTSSFTVKINGSTGAWILDPGDRMGYSPKGGLSTITLTPVSGTPLYQIMIGA